MSELGSLLKTTREEQKKTIKDVVDDTRIREPFINIMEDGRFKDLPSYLHAYGFVKKYAEFLGLDYENVVWPLFSRECPKDGAISKSTTQEEISPEDYTPQTTETSFLENGEKTSKKPMYVFFVIIVLAAVGYAGYYLYSSNYFSTSLSSSNTPASQQATVVTNNEPTITFADDNQSDNSSYFNYYGSSIYDNNTDNNSLINSAEPAFVDPLFAQNIPTPVIIEPEKITVRFSEDCWFKYRTDKGEENTIDATRGTVLNIEFDKTFRVEIGNAIAVSIDYAGQTYDNFGRRKMVRILNYEAVDGKLELVR